MGDEPLATMQQLVSRFMLLAGAVDFALVFVANYPHPRKAPAPHARAVDMLRSVLGKVRS
jgi:hypothetical protein